MAAPRVPQAARIIAQMIVMGSGVFLKAASAAYRKAIISTRPAWPVVSGFALRRPLCTPTGVAHWLTGAVSICINIDNVHVGRGADGTKAGVTAEAVGKATGSKATMTVEEARSILGIDASTPPEEVLKVPTCHPSSDAPTGRWLRRWACRCPRWPTGAERWASTVATVGYMSVHNFPPRHTQQPLTATEPTVQVPLPLVLKPC